MLDAADHVDGGHQTIVERRRALFDVTRHLAVVGHCAAAAQAPGQRGRGHQHRSDAAPASSIRPARRSSSAIGEGGADDGRRRDQRAADDRAQRAQRAPPRAHADRSARESSRSCSVMLPTSLRRTVRRIQAHDRYRAFCLRRPCPPDLTPPATAPTHGCYRPRREQPFAREHHAPSAPARTARDAG